MIFGANSFDPKSVKVIHRIQIADSVCQKKTAGAYDARLGTYSLSEFFEVMVTDKNLIVVAGAYSGHRRYLLLSDDEATSFLVAMKTGYGATLDIFEQELKSLQQAVKDCEDKIKNHKDQIKLIQKIDLGNPPKTKTDPPPEIELPGK